MTNLNVYVCNLTIMYILSYYDHIISSLNITLSYIQTKSEWENIKINHIQILDIKIKFLIRVKLLNNLRMKGKINNKMLIVILIKSVFSFT